MFICLYIYIYRYIYTNVFVYTAHGSELLEIVSLNFVSDTGVFHIVNSIKKSTSKETTDLPFEV